MRVRKAIIPAAGFGTRFLPATKAQPKEMLPIVDKPTIQYIVEEAVAAGIEDILIITGRSKRAIEDHFDRNLELEHFLESKGKADLQQLVAEIGAVDIHYIRQKEQLGLGHAIYCARSFVGNEPFAVLLGDDIVYNGKPCIGQLMDIYSEVGGSVLGVQPVPREWTSRYGIVSPRSGEGKLYEVADLVEKPAPQEAPSELAILGRYIIEPEIFGILRETQPGAGGEIQLTDALRELARRKPMYAYHFEGKRYDVGDKLGYLEATVEFALKRADLSPAFREYLKRIVASF
ncbi:MAG TPA: UTP--glucose-1-phosphate uridylyltransferase [Firmicutes bacterium]|nr:UTP--glucose-1-phosphate uridylyltransferase [Bacillota bacterium]